MCKAHSLCRECKRIGKKVKDDEGYVCSFVEVVKNAEATARQHYSRSLYAGSVSREMNKTVLDALLITLELVKTMYTMHSNTSEDKMCDEGGVRRKYKSASRCHDQ